MKTIPLSSTTEVNRGLVLNSSLVHLIINALFIIIILMSLVLAGHYIWAVSFSILGMISNFLYRLYLEVDAIDFTFDKSIITLEEIINDFEY